MCLMMSRILLVTDTAYVPLRPYDSDVVWSLDNLQVDRLHLVGSKQRCKNIIVVKKYIDIDDLLQDNRKPVVSDTGNAVIDGEYAMLFENANSISYYVRNDNTWRKDSELLSTFVLDSPHSFCTLNLRCMPDDTRTKCIPVGDAIVEIMTKLQKDIRSNLDSVDAFDIVTASNQLDRFYNKLNTSIVVKRKNATKYTVYHYKLGTTIEMVDIVISPYLSELTDILGDSDYRLKYVRLLDFCNTFTRQYNADNNLETDHWRYCIKTNVALVPTSIYEISYLYSIYAHDVPMFNNQLDLLKKRVGVLSDDGSSVVDKYTGFKISDILFDTSEDYEEGGFLEKTRDILPSDNDKDTIRKQLLDRIYNEKETVMIRYVVHIISEKMGIDMSKSMPFIIQHVHRNMPVSPGVDRLVLLLVYIISVFIITVQTMIPNIQPTQKVDKCSGGFDGYPLYGDKSQTDSITYVICVINSIKSGKDPWKTLQSYTDESVIAQIINAMENYLLNDDDIIAKIEHKKRYLSYRTLDLPDEHSVLAWNHFLPIATIADIAKSVIDIPSPLEKIKAMVDKRKDPSLTKSQREIFGLSIRIQAYIQLIISRNFKMTGKSSKFAKQITQTCCRTSSDVSMYTFLTSEEPIVGTYNSAVTSIVDTIVKEYRRLTIALPISFGLNTIPVVPYLGNPYKVHSSTIYALFAENTRNRTNMYTDRSKIMEELKKSTTYTDAEFNQLLTTLYSRNMESVPTVNELLVNTNQNPQELLVYLSGKYNEVKSTVTENETNLLSPQVIESISEICKAIVSDPKGVKPMLPKFRTFIQSRISHMHKAITSIFATIDPKNKWTNILNPKHPEYIFAYIQSKHRMVQLGMEWMKQVSCIFPNMILHKKKHYNKMLWNLAPIHIQDIHNLLLVKFDAIKEMHTPLMNAIFARIIRANLRYMDVMDKFVHISNTYLGIDTSAMFITLGLHTLILYLLEQSSITVDGKEYPAKLVQKSMGTYITTTINMGMMEKYGIDKKMLTVVDDNIQIQNIEKNQMLKEMGNLTKDEQITNKILKQLKLKRWARPENLLTYSKKGYASGERITYNETPVMSPDLDGVDADILDEVAADDGLYFDEGETEPIQYIDDDDMRDNDDIEIEDDGVDDMGDAVDYDGDYYNVEYMES